MAAAVGPVAAAAAAPPRSCSPTSVTAAASGVVFFCQANALLSSPFRSLHLKRQLLRINSSKCIRSHSSLSSNSNISSTHCNSMSISSFRSTKRSNSSDTVFCTQASDSTDTIRTTGISERRSRNSRFWTSKTRSDLRKSTKGKNSWFFEERSFEHRDLAVSAGSRFRPFFLGSAYVFFSSPHADPRSSFLCSSCLRSFTLRAASSASFSVCRAFAPSCVLSLGSFCPPHLRGSTVSNFSPFSPVSLCKKPFHDLPQCHTPPLSSSSFNNGHNNGSYSTEKNSSSICCSEKTSNNSTRTACKNTDWLHSGDSSWCSGGSSTYTGTTRVASVPFNSGSNFRSRQPSLAVRHFYFHYYHRSSNSRRKSGDEDADEGQQACGIPAAAFEEFTVESVRQLQQQEEQHRAAATTTHSTSEVATTAESASTTSCSKRKRKRQKLPGKFLTAGWAGLQKRVSDSSVDGSREAGAPTAEKQQSFNSGAATQTALGERLSNNPAEQQPQQLEGFSEETEEAEGAEKRTLIFPPIADEELFGVDAQTLSAQQLLYVLGRSSVLLAAASARSRDWQQQETANACSTPTASPEGDFCNSSNASFDEVNSSSVLTQRRSSLQHTSNAHSSPRPHTSDSVEGSGEKNAQLQFLHWEKLLQQLLLLLPTMTPREVSRAVQAVGYCRPLLLRFISKWCSSSTGVGSGSEKKHAVSAVEAEKKEAVIVVVDSVTGSATGAASTTLGAATGCLVSAAAATREAAARLAAIDAKVVQQFQRQIALRIESFRGECLTRIFYGMVKGKMEEDALYIDFIASEVLERLEKGLRAWQLQRIFSAAITSAHFPKDFHIVLANRLVSQLAFLPAESLVAFIPRLMELRTPPRPADIIKINVIAGKRLRSWQDPSLLISLGYVLLLLQIITPGNAIALVRALKAARVETSYPPLPSYYEQKEGEEALAYRQTVKRVNKLLLPLKVIELSLRIDFPNIYVTFSPALQAWLNGVREAPVTQFERKIYTLRKHRYLRHEGWTVLKLSAADFMSLAHTVCRKTWLLKQIHALLEKESLNYLIRDTAKQ